MSKPGMFGAGVGIGSNVKKDDKQLKELGIKKKMGGGMMRYNKGSKGTVKLSARQKVIAAKAPPPNKIDGKDFAVLKAEKAKGRGQGLQDEKMKPGKIMKAKTGVAVDFDETTYNVKDVYKLANKNKTGARPTLKDVRAAAKFLKVKLNPKTR